MARHRGPVLVDTMVILECWRINAWKAFAGGYSVETVEDCLIETQTGFQRRREEDWSLLLYGKLGPTAPKSRIISGNTYCLLGASSEITESS